MAAKKRVKKTGKKRNDRRAELFGDKLDGHKNIGGRTFASPQSLGSALSELITLRGWASVQGNAQLAEVWNTVANGVIGEETARKTTVQRIRRGVLTVAVSNAPLLSELVSFHQRELLNGLQKQHPELKIRAIKFQLRGRM